MNIKINLILVILYIYSNFAQAEIYLYHPRSRLYLGGGYNPYKPNEAYERCIQYDDIEKVDTTAAVTSNVIMSLVKTRSDFYEMTDYSASLAGSYAIFSGAGSYNSFEESAFHSDSLTWIIMFKTDYGKFVLKNPRLQKKFSTYDEDRFYQSCGSEVVTEERRAVFVYALFSVQNISSNVRKEIEAKFNGSASAGVWSAKAEASYKNILKTAMANSEIRLSVNAVGGDGVTKLTELIEDSGIEDPYRKFLEVPKILANYISGMSAQKSVATQYFTQPISTFKDDLPVRYSEFKNGQLGRIYTEYVNANSIIDRIDELLYGVNSANFFIDEKREKELLKIYELATEALNRLESAAFDCFELEKKCQIPNIQIPKFTWPAPRLDLTQCEQLRNAAYYANCISAFELENAILHNEFPLCSSYFSDENSFHMGWKSCSYLRN